MSEARERGGSVVPQGTEPKELDLIAPGTRVVRDADRQVIVVERHHRCHLL